MQGVRIKEHIVVRASNARAHLLKRTRVFESSLSLLSRNSFDTEESSLAKKTASSPSKRRPALLTNFLLLSLFVLVTIATYGCNLGINSNGTNGGETSGPPYVFSGVTLSPTDAAGDFSIDASSVNEGYVGASATSSTRLKFQVTLGDLSYTYDLPNDGSPIVVPLNMGDGAYTFAIWENTSEDRYIQLGETIEATVILDSEFEPFLRPSYYCDYDENSACVVKAIELCADAANEGDVLENIYTYIVSNVRYDNDKAETVEGGYIPDPDSTFQSNTGICFDYASLAAAMLRSQQIPCKIMTGYVSVDNIYHAWNMVYIDGRWTTITFNVEANTWTRIDTTFAASRDASLIRTDIRYTDRYTY